MKSPSMEPAAAAAAIPRGGAFGRVRIAYGARRAVGAGVAGPGRRRVLVAALPEPIDPLLPAQEAAVALAPEGDEVHRDVASAEIPSPPAVPGRTVRVRFVLKKQCVFGQRFHLVGDDPALGLWDPSKAIALDWSEGHDWTVEKDLPANRLVEFKFLLQDSLGKFHWQDGPNRSLPIGETAYTLVVYEDWGDEKSQLIAEEGDAVGMVGTVVLDEGENMNDVVLANELHMDDNQEIKEDESSVVEDDATSAFAASASDQGESVKAHEADQPELMMDELKIQDELHDEVDTSPQNGSVTTCTDDDYAERIDDDNILSKDGVPLKNGWTGAFERELLWGWKALQQLLMSLGFKMDTT